MVKKKKQSKYIHKQAEWAELYKQGLSFRQIAEKEGIFYRTVQNVIKDVVEIRPKQKYKEQAEEWAELYRKGLSANDIGEKYNVFTGTVTKYLKQMGVEIRYKGEKERRYQHLVDEWVKEYEQGSSLHEIGEKYNVPFQTVHTYISDKTDMRWYTETSRKYQLNEAYFDKIDIADKAYWLGFFYSTGCVIRGTGGYAVQLSVGAKDRDRLEAFKLAIESDNPIETNVSSPVSIQCQIRFHSKSLYDSLVGYGLLGDKKDTLTFPDFLERRWHSAFVLGYYEGRGSCYNSKTQQLGYNYSNTYLRIFGNEAFLNSLNQIIYEHVGISFRLKSGMARFNRNKTMPLTPFHYLETGKRENLWKFAEWLYEEKDEFSKRRDIREKLKEAKKPNDKG